MSSVNTREGKESMSRIVKVLSGGQSGADRGVLDAARQCGVPIGGWCPAGGWAEDLTTPPGVLALYPEMVETPSADVIQRTEWNIRDSTCCIVFNTHAAGTSRGTDAGYAFYEKYNTPNWTFVLGDPDTYGAQVKAAIDWLNGLNDDAIVISIGGPRASEYDGIYDVAFNVVTAILEELAK